MTGIYQLNSIQEEEAMFGEPVTYIGYPTSGGGSGTYMQASELYAITAKSSNKDGAWAFIENYLNQPFDNLYSYGMGIRFRRMVLPASATETGNISITFLHRRKWQP